MCTGDDHTCPDFELHRQKLLDDLDGERRSFLKSAFLASGGAAAAFAGAGTLATPASAQTKPGQPTYHYLPANSDTVHWGYFSKLLKPQLEVDSGDYVTIEAVTHHAGDDIERLVKGDPGAAQVPSMASYSAAAQAKASASISAPGRFSSAGLSRAIFSKSASSTSSLGPAPIRLTPASRSAATQQPGGASTTTT
jgi:hypothetical protein